MLHYLSLLWNNEEPSATEHAAAMLRRFLGASPHWRLLFQQPGIAICHRTHYNSTPHQAYVLADRKGVVLGRLFYANYLARSDTDEVPPTPVSFDSKSSGNVLASEGRSLLSDYWGEYVAFLRDPGSRRHWVLRDPTGHMPCQHMQVGGVSVYFTRLEDAERVDAVRFTINRHFMLGYLTFDSVCVRETGLNEVETVQPGECIAHAGGRRSRSFYWNPLEIAAREKEENLIESARMLRQTVRAAVHAWSSCFDGIALQLSGGLDSSIVASCLAKTPNRTWILGRNLYSVDAGSDERKFARLAAARAEIELIEQPVNTIYSFAPPDERMQTPFPYAWWMADLEGGRRDADELRKRGIDGEFTGDGGDELFYRGGPLPTAVDHAWRHGITRELLTVALDDAALRMDSLWRVLRQAFTFGVRKQDWGIRGMMPRHHRPLMTAAAQEAAWLDQELWHPLFRSSATIPPAKFAHAYILTFGTSYAYIPPPLDGMAVSMAPLQSQPLMELSLRTPLHMQIAGGRDRSLARRAFAGDVPREILTRKTKAFANAQIEAIVAHNIVMIRQLLLDGFLVRERLVNRSKLEEVLSGDLNAIPSGIVEVCTYLSVEAWARRWDLEARQKAA